MKDLLASIRAFVRLAQFFSNYDLVDNESGPGTSPYTQMNDGKIKSIDEFRKKNKKRRKKTIQKAIKTRPA